MVIGLQVNFSVILSHCLSQRSWDSGNVYEFVYVFVSVFVSVYVSVIVSAFLSVFASALYTIENSYQMPSVKPQFNVKLCWRRRRGDEELRS